MSGSARRWKIKSGSIGTSNGMEGLRMSVFRVEKNKHYTVMSNYHLRDPRLSLGAVGLLSKMLSLPDGWDYTVTGLVRLCNCGRDAIRAVLAELEATGYLVRERQRDDKGRLQGMEYVIYESPQGADEPEGAVPPTLENPTQVEPTLENQPQLNTKDIKYLDNTPPIVPPKGEARGRKKRGARTAPDWKPEAFAKFWASYPKGKDKLAAIREWDKLKPDDTMLREMTLGLARQMASEEWQRDFGIPYACRWLKDRRWEDEDRPPIGGDPDGEPVMERGAYRL